MQSIQAWFRGLTLVALRRVLAYVATTLGLGTAFLTLLLPNRCQP